MHRAMSKQEARLARLRAIRFIVWAVAMCVTGLIVGIYAPHRVVMVPCIFVAIMVPAVLLPLNPKEDKTH